MVVKTNEDPIVLHSGESTLELGGEYLGDLRDANDLLGDWAALRERMQEDGYLLLRGLQPVEKVQIARTKYLEALDEAGLVDHDYPLDDGVIKSGPDFKGDRAASRTPDFLQLVESPEILNFFEGFLGGEVLTFGYKWLRAVKKGFSTGCHMDGVYMNRGTKALYTCWTPIGNLDYKNGVLMVLPGSHREENWKKVRDTYGKMDSERDQIPGWLSTDPVQLTQQFGGRWATTTFEMGDVMIFGMNLLHCSIVNETNRYRLSSDTRYQLAADKVDERWIDSKSAPAEDNATKTMRQARQEWGL